MMTDTYWHKQTTGSPLFPDLQWSRPENRTQAGKLLIIGGNVHGFAAPAEAYQAAAAAGVGTIRILLPDAVKKVAGAMLPGVEYAASTPSGSFARDALAEWLEQAAWADGVLLAGDLGRNSETAILLEGFLDEYIGRLTLTKDAGDYMLGLSDLVLRRKDTLLVLTMAQLRKLAQTARYRIAFTLDMDLLRLVDGLHGFTTTYAVNLIVRHLDHLIVAVEGEISTTPIHQEVWRATTSASAAVWWLQNPTKPFEALTTTVFEIVKE